MLRAIEIKPDVYWVGGTTGTSTTRLHHRSRFNYNAYLIMDEHITLIDTCKGAFADDLVEHISDIVDPSRIEYVVSNHVEQDHSGLSRA